MLCASGCSLVQDNILHFAHFHMACMSQQAAGTFDNLDARCEQVFTIVTLAYSMCFVSRNMQVAV